jgi:hypothetical protein
MKQVVIENPVINSPFEKPQRHFRFNDDGITNEIVEDRSSSAYFVPIPPRNKKSKELKIATISNRSVPAVNNYGGFDRWPFLEISDPWNAAPAIRAALR